MSLQYKQFNHVHTKSPRSFLQLYFLQYVVPLNDMHTVTYCKKISVVATATSDVYYSYINIKLSGKPSMHSVCRVDNFKFNTHAVHLFTHLFIALQIHRIAVGIVRHKTV